MVFLSDSRADALSALVELSPEVPGPVRGEVRHCFLGAAEVEAQAAAPEVFLVEVSQQSANVAGCRLGAPASVARRPRRRAGTVRPNLEQPTRLQPGDGAVACTHRGDVDQATRRQRYELQNSHYAHPRHNQADVFLWNLVAKSLKPIL